MTGLTVLITGVTRYIGSALAGRLADHPGVERVIGVDAALPEPAARSRMGSAEFARADIRNPLIFKVMEAAGVDTVVHASVSSSPSGSAARSMVKEMNVLGTMQLLAACQRSAGVRNLIVRSTAAVYGSSPRDPAVASEDTPARSVPSTGAARDAIDIEGYVRGFGRRRPDVRIAVPRFAEIIGPTVRTPLTQYFSMSPFVPVIAGHDARIQLVHELDVVALIEHLVLGDCAGTVNVAGDGAMTIAQAIHRAGRVPVPVPAAALDGVSRVLRLLRLGGFSAAQVRQFGSGRVLDTTRLREVGFTPRFSTTAAFDDFVSRLEPAVEASTVRDAELRVAAALGFTPEPEGVWRGAAVVPTHPGAVRSSGKTTRTSPKQAAPENRPAPAAPDSLPAQAPPTRVARDGSTHPPRTPLFSIDGDASGSVPRSARPGGRKR